jgi:hypothetical protein
MTCVVIPADPANQDSFFGPGDRFVFTRSWGNWHLVRRRFLVWNTHGPSLGGYEVDLWEIDSHRELVDWLFHVGGKTMDPSDFFEAMRTIFRSTGQSQTIDGKALAIKYWNDSVPHKKSIHTTCPHCFSYICPENKEPNGSGNGCEQCIDKL